jgi:hypothetical protein
LRAVGIGVLAAGVTAIIDRHAVSRELGARIRRCFEDASEASHSLAELGIRSAHSRLDFGHIFREAKKGETVSWLDTYCPRESEFEEELIAALDRGVHVRMLTIEPGCINALNRNAELQSTFDTGGGWETGLKAFIAKMEAVSSRGVGQFEMRFYDDLPCAPMYLIGKPSASGKPPVPRKSYFSLYLVRASAGCPHVELSNGAWLQDMAKYFDAKWARHSTAGLPPGPENPTTDKGGS